MAPQAPEYPSVTGEAVVVVDPYSTGCCIALEFQKNGFELIAIWTRGFSEEMKTHVPLSCKNLRYYAELEEEDSLQKTAETIYQVAGEMTIVSCLAAGEAGVDYADALSEYMGLLTNGTDIPNRRDKKLQQELIKARGLRSVRQAGGDKFEDVEEFLRTEEYPVVLKPVESAGSDGVKLCHSFEEAKEHFHLLMKSQMVNGGMCPSVLCQEFLKGKEYIVDHVSRDGVHKTTMIYVYDKRKANGSAFVYYGSPPVESDTEEAQILIPYVRSVLDALGVKHGPSHGEVVMTADGPCLVEMNCRAHGGDGIWRPLASALTGGYTQVDATVLAYVDPDGFKALPDRPGPFQAAGTYVDLVSYSRGVVKRTPGFDLIRCLPSFLNLETCVKIGSEVELTVDLVTTPGSVILMHKDRKVLERDVQFLRLLEDMNGLFVYETNQQTKPTLMEADVCMNEDKGHHCFLNADGPNLIRRTSFDSHGPTLIRKMSNDRPELRGH